MGNCASKPPLPDTESTSQSDAKGEEKQKIKGIEGVESSHVKVEVMPEEQRGSETPTPSSKSSEAKESPSHDQRRPETPESDSGSGDELEAKLKSTIDRSRLSLKEKELYNAVQSLERTCELKDLTHKQEASKTAFDLCSCISNFIVESAMMTSESARTSRLLQNQRSICEKLQNANELIDAERLAIEFQKYEKETELEETHFKYVEIKEKYDLQEDLHLKEQRAFETASQELKIKYEKHFKSLSSEIENLQKKCSVLDSSSKSQLQRLGTERDSLKASTDTTIAELTSKNHHLEGELVAKVDLLSKMGKECTDLQFMVDSMERHVVGLEGVGIHDLMEEIATTVESFFQDFVRTSDSALNNVRILSSDVGRALRQMDNSQIIVHALQETIADKKKAMKETEGILRKENASLRSENKSLRDKLADTESELALLKRQLADEKRLRAGFQEKYLDMRDSTPLSFRGKTPKYKKPMAEEVDAIYKTYYTPNKAAESVTSFPLTTYSSPVRENLEEESELELLGQLDAQKTFEEVERQVFQILKEERMNVPGKTEDEAVHSVMETNRSQMKPLMHEGSPASKFLKESKKKLEYT